MGFPNTKQPFIDLGGSGGRLGSQWIPVVVAALQRRGTKMNHAGIPIRLVRLARAGRRPKARRARPVRRAVNRSAVAQHDCRGARVGDALQLSLDKEDGALPTALPFTRSDPWESAAEDD